MERKLVWLVWNRFWPDWNELEWRESWLWPDWNGFDFESWFLPDWKKVF
jgi:hypothetical protein